MGWTKIGNLKGPKGDPGDPGAPGGADVTDVAITFDTNLVYVNYARAVKANGIVYLRAVVTPTGNGTQDGGLNAGTVFATIADTPADKAIDAFYCAVSINPNAELTLLKLDFDTNGGMSLTSTVSKMETVNIDIFYFAAA